MSTQCHLGGAICLVSPSVRLGPQWLAFCKAVVQSGFANENTTKQWNLGNHAFEFSSRQVTVSLLEPLYKSLSLMSPVEVWGVGGGGVMDAAKALRWCLHHKISPLLLPVNTAENFTQVPNNAPKVRLTLTSTSVGSGAEQTGFATLWQGNKKFSLDAPGVGADTVFAWPQFLETLPFGEILAGGADAFCHAVESVWARSASAESVALACAALETLPIAWECALEQGGALAQVEALARLQQAAGVAARAIALSRTTGAHALSYGVTAHFGVSHGLAVALFLPPLCAWHEAHACEHASLTEALNLLRQVLRVPKHIPLSDWIRDFFMRLGVYGAVHGAAHGAVLPCAPAAWHHAVAQGFDAQRLGNNPIVPTAQERVALAAAAFKDLCLFG